MTGFMIIHYLHLAVICFLNHEFKFQNQTQYIKMLHFYDIHTTTAASKKENIIKTDRLHGLHQDITKRTFN